MKNTQKCPKCGGTDIITVEPALYNSFPAGFFAQAKLERWVCCTCGFSEEWVESKSLEAVKKFWSGPAKQAERE